MKTKLIGIFLMMTIFISCKNDKKETIILKPNQFTDINIELLDNQKWVVDKPMMDIIQNIKKDVMQFNGKTLDDYQNLSHKIDKNLSVLTTSCTMTGQGHDELHKWLLPFLEISKAFAKSETLKDAQENYQVIKHSFSLVDNNFK